MSNAIFVIGRILAVLVFIGSGLGHLTDKNMVGYAQFKKIPSAALAVRISGVASGGMLAMLNLVAWAQAFSHSSLVTWGFRSAAGAMSDSSAFALALSTTAGVPEDLPTLAASAAGV